MSLRARFAINYRHKPLYRAHQSIPCDLLRSIFEPIQLSIPQRFDMVSNRRVFPFRQHVRNVQICGKYKPWHQEKATSMTNLKQQQAVPTGRIQSCAALRRAFLFLSTALPYFAPDSGKVVVAPSASRDVFPFSSVTFGL